MKLYYLFYIAGIPWECQLYKFYNLCRYLTGGVGMKRLKLRFFLTKYRIIIIVLIVISLVGVVTFGVLQIDSDKIMGNSTLFGVIGTLLGALIGGVFSLMGSVWVNSKQQRAVQNVKRKNVIYSPLYDELVDIQDHILKKNPYPNYIFFKKEIQTILPHPQFTAWRRIKSDTRYLEVPDVLVKQMEQLEESIHYYQEVRQKANDEIQNILNSVLKDNNLNTCSLINVGSIISGDILNQNEIDIYHKTMEIGNEKTIDEFTREKINKEIYYRCNNAQAIIEVRKKYKEWLNIQRQTIEMLSILIKQILVRYEG